MNPIYDVEIVNFMLIQRIKTFSHVFLLNVKKDSETYRFLVNLDLLGKKWLRQLVQSMLSPIKATKNF